MLKIGEFAALAKISIRMLRHYDEIGLLKPLRVDRENSYRYYTLEQLARLNRILALRDLGLGLGEIRLLLDEALSAEEIRGMLKLKQAQLHHLISEEQARLRRVENRLRYIEQEGQLPETEVVIKPQPALHVIALHGTGYPGYLFNVVYAALSQQNLAQYVLGYMTIYHGSMEYQRTGKRDPNWTVAAAHLIDESVQAAVELPDSRQLVVEDIPAYPQVASLLSTKPDKERHLDALLLWQWIAQHRYRLIAPTREIYLKRPRPASDAYLTEIMFPIASIDEE